MIKKVKPSFVGLIAGFILIFTGVTTAFGANAPAPEAYRIVALGDSITVGYEPELTQKSVPVPYGYADRLYEQALFHGRAKLDNFGVLGLRTEGMKRLLQGALDGKPLKSVDLQDFPAAADPRVIAYADSIAARTGELKTSLSQADLVVMTIGANDFTDSLQSLLAQSTDDAVKTLDGNFITRVNKYAEEAEKVIRETSTLAPGARILLTDQYLPLPKLFKPDLYDILYDKAVAPLTAAVDDLAAKLRGEGLNVEAVHIAAKFAGHEGSMTHMNVSLTGDSKPDIHPTQTGYQAIAEAFAGAVWKEYRKPAQRASGVPVSIVVGGRELNTLNKPVFKNNTTFIALGDVLKALGTKYQWTAKSKTAVFQKNGRKVSVTVGAKTVTVSGVKLKLNAAPYVQKVGKEQQVYVPLELIQQALQYNVIYRQPIQTAFINP
jgi:lysophospholipase L1-like esterase